MKKYDKIFVPVDEETGMVVACKQFGCDVKSISNVIVLTEEEFDRAILDAKSEAIKFYIERLRENK